MKTKLIGQLDVHGSKFRLTFSCGKDPVTGDYLRIRVGPFARRGDALNAQEELQGYAEKRDWVGLVRYAETPILEGDTEIKPSWGTSGWDPLDRPPLDTLAGLAAGFAEWRKTHFWGKKDRWGPASSRTIEAYRETIKDLDHPALNAQNRLGSRNPERVTKGDVESFSRQIQKAVSADKATRCVDFIRQVLEWASSIQGLLPRNVARDLRGPGRGVESDKRVSLWDSAGSPRKAPIGAFTPEETARVLAAAYRYDPALGILAEATVRMARLGEAAALHPETGFVLSDDGRHAEMHVNGGVQALPGGGFSPSCGKHIGRPGNIVNRVIPIPVSFYLRVQAWAASDERRRRAKLNKLGGQFLLLNRDGNPITSATWRKLQERVYPAAGFTRREIKARRLTANSLRHSGLTAAVLNGEQAELIAMNAGNSVDMIRKVYFHASKDQLEGIAVRLLDFEI